jgi:hypothetical protein
MAKITNQVSLTLELNDFHRLEKIAQAYGHRPGGAARLFVLERLNLYETGWKISDDRLSEIIKTVCSLAPEDLKKLEGYLKRLGNS